MEAVLSHRLWRSYFGSDPAVVGRSLRIDQDAYEIVRVMPAFMRRLGTEIEVWAAEPLDRQARSGYEPIVRLRPQVAIESARAELEQRYRDSLVAAGREPGDVQIQLEPLLEAAVDGDLSRRTPARFRALLLLGLGVLVLALAFSNTAHAVFLHGLQRRTEFAVRVSLGADRADLVRQTLCEAAVLVVGIAIVAVAAMMWLGNAILKLLPYSAPANGERTLFLYELPIWELPAMSAASWAVLAAIVCGALIVVGLIPAVKLSNVDVAEDLKSAMAITKRQAGNQRFGQLFVANQVALTFVVLVAAGLFVRTIVSLDRVRMIPGVEAVTISNSFQNWQATGLRLPDDDSRVTVEWEFVDDNYFDLLGIELERGRNFGDQDRLGSPNVAIVSKAFASRYFPENPIDRAFHLMLRTHPDRYRRFTIVGVAADTRRKQLGVQPRSVVYLSFRQFPDRFTGVMAMIGSASLLVRTAGDPGAVVPDVRRAVASLSRDVALLNVEPLVDTLNRNYAETYGYFRVLTALGAVALLLALFGIFGVVAHHVRMRLHELGVRQALGALPADVMRTVMRRNLLILAGGLPAGALLALWLSRYLASMLHGVTPTDPVSFTAAGLLVLATFLIATLIPVGRALRSCPAEILRER